MVVKLIIFDLDGVLTNTRDLHYHTLNNSLRKVDEKYVISLEEHLSTFDGQSTTSKLKLLTKTRGLDPSLYTQIWEDKQKNTVEYINSNLSPDFEKIEMLKSLKEKGYTVYVATNSIYETVKQILVKKGFIDYVDYFISNQDVINPKPSPEIYLKCVIRSGFTPRECLIIEDSPIGRRSAISSGCNVMAVSDFDTYNLKDILHYIEKINKDNIKEKIPWNGKLNVLIPMAGRGSRFEKMGYKLPKPLVEVNKSPMIQKVVENVNCDPKVCRFIFVVQKDHYEKYCLNYILNLISPGCEIIQVDQVTEGATCTCLLAKEFINTDEPLLLANSDQILEWDVNEFLYSMMSNGIDGGITTFTDTDPKWSFVKLDDNGYVQEVAEKKPISDIATTGVYFWKRGKDFVKYAEQMISKNIRVNNEFYVCPIYNEMIQDGKKIKIFNVKKMWGIGTPEDLNFYLQNHSD